MPFIRHRIAILLLALLATPAAITAGAQPSLIAFDSAKVEPGTLLHYVKSNRDGSQPWPIDVYLVSPTRIEVVKHHQGGADMVVVEADLDPVRGHMAHAFQTNFERETSRATMAESISADGKIATVELADGTVFRLPVEGKPFHFYGFDFLGLGWLLPHLREPGKAFEITFADTNRPATAEGQPFLLATARFEPAGEEEVHGKRCRKYLLKGPFFQGFEGTLWADVKTGRLEKAESSLRTSTDWEKDFELELRSTEKIGDFEWQKRKEAIRRGLAAEAAP